ncbi:MAG: acyl-CoA dehydrogenase family protein [Burkholderiaceae bacterium]
MNAATDTDRLLAEADAIAGEIAPRVDEIERLRHLPADLSRRMAGAGLFRLLVPREYGGLEVHPRVFVDVVERVGRVDGSSAWCVMIGATAATCAAFLPPATARELFADPGVTLAGVFAPRGTAVSEARGGVDGYRVSGRWAWGSGSRNAHFVLGGCLVPGPDGKPQRLPGGAPAVRSVVFKAAEVRLLDTWDVSGLAGTGSTDFEVADVWVPATRTCSYLTDPPLPVPLYCFPTFGLLALGIAAVCLGMARGAIDALVELAGAKKPDASSKVLAERPGTQLQVAEAEAHLRAARAFVDRCVDVAWAQAERGGAIAIDARRDLRLAATHAVRAATRAIDLAYGLGGGSSVYRRSPLQRFFRDAHVATQHMMVSDASLELAGRLFLGLPTDATML